jgi:hypothetical protein
MEKIKKFFTELFMEPAPQQNALEAYILAHNPTSVGDVDYWTYQFDRLQHRRNQGMFGTNQVLLP